MINPQLKRYILTMDYGGVNAGTHVTKMKGHDYGLAADDTRLTGVEHVTVTRNPWGDYPGFTVPVHILKEVGPS